MNLIPESLRYAAQRAADLLSSVLSGEPARAIGYGGAVIVYVVAGLVNAIPDVTLDQAILQVTAVLAVAAPIVESIRRIVYSPDTVEAILAELDEDEGADTA